MTRFSTTTFRPTRFCDSRSASYRAAVAVSACLAGEKVRYDGADKRLSLYPLLQRELHLIPICPELGAGLGVPRPPVQLVDTDGGVRALGRDDPAYDVTPALQAFAAQSVQRLRNEYALCGYLWKSRSPSCGLGSTPIFGERGEKKGDASGIQADFFQRHLPYLCFSEESALTTTTATLCFVLRSRLVFDILHTTPAPLSAVHECYSPLWLRFDPRRRDCLADLSKTPDRENYLTALLQGSRQIEEELLLELFV